MNKTCPTAWLLKHIIKGTDSIYGIDESVPSLFPIFLRDNTPAYNVSGEKPPLNDAKWS